MSPARNATPTHVRIRAYNVGFGDCYLLTVTYRDDSRRHMLIDFGSTKGAGTNLRNTGEAIATETAGEGLAVGVVTHQHADHIAGFATAKIRRSDPVPALQPKLLIRSWMDNPKPSGVGPDSKRHALLLANMNTLVQAAQNAVPGARKTLAGSLLAMQLKPTVAGGVLDDWASNGTTVRWVKAGDSPSLRQYMPGVTIDILGPPTVEQVPFLASYDRDDPEQFWVRHANAAAAIHDRLTTQFTQAELDLVAGSDGLGAAAWLAQRMNRERRANLLAAARGFDSFLNNTSVIALITVGKRTLLFCGDAQIENWAHVLARADALTPGLRERFEDTGPPEPDGIANALANIDLYKVGHHGSKNANPKTLFELWNNQRLGTTPVVTVMSTLPRFHGERSNRSEVPRSTLVRALRDHTRGYSTHMLEPEDPQHWLDLTAPTTGSGTFTGRRGALDPED